MPITTNQAFRSIALSMFCLALVALLITLSATTALQAQTQTQAPQSQAQPPQRHQLLEEIQAVPEGLVGTWTIGGLQMEVKQRHLVNENVPIETGTLAAVLFVKQADENVVLKIQPLPFKAGDLDDGPYVNWKSASTAEVISLVDGKVQRRTHENISQPIQIKAPGTAESAIVLDPALPPFARSVWDTPSRLLAISDLEGHYSNVKSFLQINGVIDRAGRWSWGDGHLVLVGDLVDRGGQVTELLWMIRRLEREAAAAGGHVHYILGNHEAMVMAGDLRYIHPKYIVTSQRIGIPYDQLFNEFSDLGRWLRSKNAVEKIGNLLFVHGGYSPMLDAAGLDLDTLNQRVRAGLAPAVPTGDSPDINPVGHQHGPFWYRGYFDQHAATWGKATPEQVQRILDRHGVDHIVIGHTLVSNVGTIDDTGQVIAIDVKWQDPSKGEGLLVQDGTLRRLTVTREQTAIKLGTSKRRR